MSEWIRVEDRLPGIDTIVELKFNEYGREYQYSSKLSSLVTLSHMTHWRPIPEKRPDFSRLRKGDIVVIEYSTHKKDVDGLYPIKIHSMNDIVIYSETSGNYLFEGIKKITRINLENETFEEI